MGLCTDINLKVRIGMDYHSNRVLFVRTFANPIVNYELSNLEATSASTFHQIALKSEGFLCLIYFSTGHRIFLL
jgi:hypothetical protein